MARVELRFLAWAFWHSAYNTQAALTAPPHVPPGLNLGAPRFSDWLGRMPIRPGQTPLALVPPYEKWALEILTRTDYDDYWWTHGSKTMELSYAGAIGELRIRAFPESDRVTHLPPRGGCLSSARRRPR